MKTKFFALLVGVLLMAGGLCVQAQSSMNNEAPDNKPRWTEEEWMQRRAERMAFSLMLDDQTEAKFITLYTQYLKDLMACRDQYREEAPKGKEVRKPRELTDADIEKRIEDRFAQQRQLLDIREGYYKDFKKMLTPKQLQKIFDSVHWDVNRSRWDKNRRPDGRRDYRSHPFHHHSGCCWWER